MPLALCEQLLRIARFRERCGDRPAPACVIKRNKARNTKCAMADGDDELLVRASAVLKSQGPENSPVGDPVTSTRHEI